MALLDDLWGGISNLFGGASQGMQGMQGMMQNGLGAASRAMGMGQGGGGQGGGQGNGPMSGFNPMATGLGLMGASQAFGGQTKLPSFQTPQMQQFQNFNPQNFQTMNPAMQKSIQDTLNIQNEQSTRNLRDTYQSARPGTDYTTDSAYQRDLANLQRSQSQNASDMMAQAQMGFNSQQLQANQQQLGQLESGAGNSVNEIMAKAGLHSQQQQQFKNMLSGLGGSFVNKGLWPNGMMGQFGGNKQQGQAPQQQSQGYDMNSFNPTNYVQELLSGFQV